MNKKVNADVLSGVEDAPVETVAQVQNFDENGQRQRPRQRVLDGLQQQLAVYADLPGYFLAIVNDEGGRIDECLRRGYDFVRASEIEGVNGNVGSYNTDPGGKVRFVVNKSGPEPTYGYLMKQLQEHRDEDLADLEKRNALVDDAIRQGTLNQQPGDQRYVPKSVGITYDPRRAGNPQFR